MSTHLSEQEVKHIADLCNIKLSPEETDRLQAVLSDTLEYIEILNEVNTDRITETFQVTGLVNVFQQENEEATTLTKEEALANAAEELDGKFATKGVFNQ